MEQRILIVDDNKFNQNILVEILKDDFSIQTVESGESALDTVASFKPHIILLDIMMPGIDGYEVCEKVRNHPEFSRTKILLVSAKDMLEDRLKGYKAGADDYITKPFEEDELYAKVKVFSKLVEEEERRMAAETEMRQNERKFRSIFSQANDAIFLLDAEGKVVDCNEKTEQMFVRGKEDIIAHPFLEFSTEFQVDEHQIKKPSAEILSRNIRAADEGESLHFDWEQVRKNGEIFSAEVGFSSIEFDDHHYILAVVRDITERKNFENQLFKANEEMQALSETGALVATVAHDAKKFTSAMSMSLEGLIIPMLRERLVQSEEWVMDLMNDILEVHSNAEQCTRFLESLLAINRKTEKIEPISSVDIVHQAFGLLSYNLMQEKVEWKVHYEPGRKMMVLGNSQLIRVFMNLIANASDALKKYGTEHPLITVTIEETDDQIAVSVHDNGPGIKPEVLENIRKGIRVSTKGKGGNGFGVSGATKIVKTCGGNMDIFSEPGKGATFLVSLPKAEEDKKQDVDLDGIDLF